MHGHWTEEERFDLNTSRLGLGLKRNEIIYIVLGLKRNEVIYIGRGLKRNEVTCLGTGLKRNDSIESI